jgi:zona occludens toxin (predicted ATPase)
MPIESITGKPGNAKTAFLVDRLMTEAQKAERPLWAAGIDGLVPGYAQILKDPRQWNAVKDGHTCTCNDTEDASECTAHVVPNGALIFIDEAWKWFGHLHDATRQATPPHVLQLAEHRHRGIDFIWTYQSPKQIFPFAREMMAEHRHLVRKFGTNFCDAYDWQELQEDVKSPAKRDAAQKTVVAIPKRTFDKYKSAEVHTIKRKLPAKVYAIPIMIVGGLALGWFGLQQIMPSSVSGRLAETATESADPATAPGGSSQASPNGESGPEAPITAAEYAKRHLPRFASMPWTAPVYDDRPITAEPELYCAVSRAGLDGQGVHSPGRCRCYTEQGTRYDIAEGECRRVAERGTPYNPYRAKRQPTQMADRERGAPAVGFSAAATATGTRTPFGSPPRPSGTFALDPAGGAP